MSENTFPFPGDEAPYDDAPAEGNRSRILVFGALGAAVVLGGGYLLFGGSSAPETVDSAAVVRPPSAVKPAAVKPVVKLPTAYKEQLGRSPFLAQYLVPVAAPVSVGAPAAAPTSIALPPISGSAAKPTTTVSAPVTKRYALKLVAISDPQPEVRFSTWLVDGQRKTVLPGQRFGKYGELVVLAFSQNDKGVVDKAILQVGDDSPIDVAVGETNSVM